MDKMEFYWNGIEPLIRVGVVGTLAYISIILILRISGKRTLSSMNAFDYNKYDEIYFSPYSNRS